MNEEINRIYKNIAGIYNGQPWYGDNILSYLEGISAENAVVIPSKLNHSIAEIIAHITAWRIFVVEKLNGNAEHEVWDTELNWQKIESLSESEWQGIKNDLEKSQKLLLEAISQIDEAKLTEKVDKRGYNFRLMLQGIAQHDIYHLGQISMIKKLVC